jgi:tetratricopeptide (TPR) repeat protein
MRSSSGSAPSTKGRHCRRTRRAGFILPALLLIGCLPLVIGASSWPASAQFASIDIAQPDLVKKSAAEQSATLAEAVRAGWHGRNCGNPKVSLEKTYQEGGGGWLVLCDQGEDYWVLVFGDRPEPKVGVLPCVLARQSGTDCYANIHTVSPDDIKQCASAAGPPDRIIRSCSAIIQSHQFDNRPEALHLAYVFRAIAFAGYQQYELAIADLDDAIAMQPVDTKAHLVRALALDHTGQLDQALSDLAKVLDANPNDQKGLFVRGSVYLKKGEYDRAIADLDKLLSINPQDDKAADIRAEAMKAKANPPSPKVAAVLTSAFPQGTNEQAAYCLEASFGFSQQLFKLATLLRENQKKGQALLDGPTLSPQQRTQLATQMALWSDRIASTDADKKSWDANGMTFVTYAQKNGLFNNSGLISSMSGQVREDQETVQKVYRACLRACVPNDETCHQNCNDSAMATDAHRHMQHCAEIAASFK